MLRFFQLFGLGVVLFAYIYALASPIGFSWFLGHLLVALLSLLMVNKLSKYWLFWLLLIVSVFAIEPRFALEYSLIISSIFFFGSSKLWLDLGFETRRNILIVIFALLGLGNPLGLSFSEKGSLILWLPVFLSLYFLGPNNKNKLAYFFSAIFCLFANKISGILAFILSLRSKFFYILFAALFGAAFFCLEGIEKFWRSSALPRIDIWATSFKEFLTKPLFGHGLGVFGLDFPLDGDIGLRKKLFIQVFHGHSLVAHLGFELGLLGIVLCLLFFYIVYKYARPAFLPVLAISLFDSSLSAFNQLLLAGLVLMPFLFEAKSKAEPSEGFLARMETSFLSKLPIDFQKGATVLAYLITLLVFGSSLLGHWHYKNRNYEKAIFFDRYNALYYFMNGYENLGKNPELSLEDMEKAVELSPRVAYFYGFLAASYLANQDFDNAKLNIDRAIELSGKDPYWLLLKAYAYHDDKEIHEKYLAKAFKKAPEIKVLLADPNNTSSEYLGGPPNKDTRLAGFYRTGKRVYLPLPILLQE